MNAKIKIAALFLVATIVCTVTAMFVPTGMSGDAGSGATVVAVPPEIESVVVSPSDVTVLPGTTVEITVTATVFCPCGVDWLEKDEVTSIEPHYIYGTPLPIKMKRVGVEGVIRATYAVTLEIPCCQPAGEYTVTVTAHDKDDNTATGTATFSVGETIAMSVTNVEFGSLAPGQSSEAQSTVTNLGNVRFKFDESDGIMPSDMRAGKKDIAGESTAVTWDWSTVVKRGYFSPGENVKEAGFTLTVPFGTPPGRYTGQIVFTPTPTD